MIIVDLGLTMLVSQYLRNFHVTNSQKSQKYLSTNLEPHTYVHIRAVFLSTDIFHVRQNDLWLN